MANEAERALRHAVRVRVVLRYAGELCLVLGLAALVPVAGAVALGEPHLLLPYAGVALTLLALGLLGRRARPPRELQHNEALAVTVLVFVLSPLILSTPLVAQGVPAIDAVFEAISGVTTTGLSTLASVEDRPRTFLLARAWMQWIGGLGFVVLSLALVQRPGVAARRLGAPSLAPGDFVGSMRAHARSVLLVYLALSAAGFVVLLLLGATPFDAVVHTWAAVSTGGFAPRDASLAELGRRLQCGILLLSLLGAVSLPLYADLRGGRWRRLRDDPELRMLLLLVVSAGALLLATRQGADAAPADLALLAVSAQTTAGFATVPLDGVSAAGKAVLVAAMLVGGSQGSTAGGFKLLRALLVLRLVHGLVVQTRLPARAVWTPTLAGQPLESTELLRAGAIILLFLAAVAGSWLVFLVHGYAPLDALFEVASATGTVGLSSGISRPGLEPLLKGVLCVDMLLGRLEIFAILVFVSPRTWIGRRVD